jgi:phage terminase small subunit
MPLVRSGFRSLDGGAMTARRVPEPPAHLARRSKAWWRSVVVEFDLADHHLNLLRLACEALDRADAARAAIDLHGTTYVDRFDQPRVRPEVAIERDSRIGYARLVRDLGLDAEASADRRFLVNRLSPGGAS